jgi:hypothetical protein
MFSLSKINFSALITACIAPTFVFANPVKLVGTPVVNKGLSTIEYRGGFSLDNETPMFENRYFQRVQMDHGFTDSYALRLVSILERRDNEEFDHEAMLIENRVQVIERRDHGWDGGFRVSYLFQSDSKRSDIAELRWHTLVPMQEWEFRHIVILQHQTARNVQYGIMPEMRWQLNKEIFPRKRLGIEMFNETGNLRDRSQWEQQFHELGLVSFGNITDNWRYQIGWRHAISQAAPDQSVKFFLAHDF